MISLLTATFIVLLAPLQGGSQAKSSSQGGVISGTVFNHEGRPVAKADVFAAPARGFRAILPHTLTDVDGKFKIAGLQPGTYFMGAEKTSEGYASNRDSFASAGLAEVPQIVLLENQIVNGVTVRFGPKSARLSGRIIDARTKKSVEDAQIILRRANNPKQFYSTSVESKFNVLVPPLPFTVEVKASGYQDWKYSSSLTLSSGQRRGLVVSLQPK